MVYRLVKLAVTIGFIPIFLPIQAQILDDSTRLVYGPKTTKIIYQEEVFRGLDTLHTVDTALNQIHNFYYNYREGNYYQDLGVMYTAINPVFFQLNNRLGRQFGLRVFDVYSPEGEGIRYFDTKSPYSKVTYQQGGRGQNGLKVEFSTPIKPNLNFGFFFKRATSDRQINTQRRQNLVLHNSVLLSSRFTGKNKRYEAYFNFNNMRHDQQEQGGIKLAPGRPKDDYFLYDLVAETNLKDSVRNYETRNNWHLYHQYYLNPARSLAIFHEFDRKKQKNSFDDTINYASNFLFYNSVNPDLDTAKVNFYDYRHHHHFTLIENKLGLRLTKDGYFLRAFAKQRNVLMSDEGGQTPHYREYFINLYGDFKLNESGKYRIIAETEFAFERDHRLRVEAALGSFNLAATRANITPDMISQRFKSAVFSWDNPGFFNTNTDELKATWTKSDSRYYLKPGIGYIQARNYIYYNQKALPEQQKDAFSILESRLEAGIVFGKFHIETDVRINSISGTQAVRIPDLFTATRYYIQNKVFRKTLLFQLGMEARHLAGYMGNAWMPATFQYHLQDTFSIQNYWQLDLFLNFQIKRSNVFLKLNHLNQGMFGSNGYFVTPYYTAQRRYFEFGFNWIFYD